MAHRFTIVGLGEALFDIFPDREVLGGAPLNVAVHAHQLGNAVGGRGVVVSRVGQDELGQQLLADLRSRDMTTHYVQTDPEHATGVVYVDLADPRSPSYDIVTDVAWDFLQFDPDAEQLALQCQAVCFGSLAQRSGVARDSIIRFLSASRRAVKLFDVNLRQDFYNAAILRRSCDLATAVKLNREEMPIVARQLGLTIRDNTPGENEIEQYASALVKEHDLSFVALTRGAEGTLLMTPQGRVEGEGAVSYAQADGADSVGAGDACSAGLLVGLALRWPLPRVVDLGNHMGAYVASQPGATPKLTDEMLGRVKTNA